MKEKSIIKKAHRLLKSVLSSKWIISSFTDGVSKCCALGHYGRLTGIDSYELLSSSKNFLPQKYDYHSHIARINDGNINPNYPEVVKRYSQSTIKRRVITLLKDMVKEGF